MLRPEETEYAPYYGKYITQVPGDGVMPTLVRQTADLKSLVGGLGEERGTDAYEPGKWSIKEVLSHLIDGERIFSYRILRISRGDETPIEGFEQDGYIENSNANNRPFSELLDEFDLQRRANLLLLKNISDDGSRLMGTASGMPVSVRALAWISAGHVEHHAAILRDRYLAS